MGAVTIDALIVSEILFPGSATLVGVGTTRSCLVGTRDSERATLGAEGRENLRTEADFGEKQGFRKVFLL